MGKRWVMGVASTGVLLAGLGVIAARAGTEADRPARPPFERGGGEGHGVRGRWNALSPEDRAAFTDARIAAIHAGLKLGPDQETLWPPVETAIRDLARQRQAQAEARRTRARIRDDAPGALRAMADTATARGEALRRLADAATPLYATLDEGQKRRALVLARPMRRMGHGGMGPGGWGGHGGREPGGDE